MSDAFLALVLGVAPQCETVSAWDELSNKWWLPSVRLLVRGTSYLRHAAWLSSRLWALLAEI